MSQCLKRILPQCSRSLSGCEVRRNFSNKRFTKVEPASQPLLDLEAVHKDWKSGGYFPRAPAHVVRHGAKCLHVQLSHARLTDHVFGGEEYRLFPLHAKLGDRNLDFGTLLSSSQTEIPPQVDWSVIPTHTDKKYSLILYSPDCSNCKLHWWVSNINTSDVTPTCDDVTPTCDDVTPTCDDVTPTCDDVTVLPYVPAVPLKGTGVYRYVLVLLEQNSDISNSETSRLTELSSLITQQNLLPVGLAFYQSFWDKSVGRNLATHLGLDEQQYTAERPKHLYEFYAEEQFLRKEWELKTDLM